MTGRVQRADYATRRCEGKTLLGGSAFISLPHASPAQSAERSLAAQTVRCGAGSWEKFCFTSQRHKELRWRGTGSGVTKGAVNAGAVNARLVRHRTEKLPGLSRNSRAGSPYPLPGFFSERALWF
jgi:hypothetical protein